MPLDAPLACALPPDRAAHLRAALPAHLPVLRTRARHLCRRDDDADDVLSDTVERALRFADSYHPGTNLRGWLLSVMFSVFITRCRRRRRERSALDALGVDPELAPQPMAPPPVRLGRRVEAAVVALPAPFRDVVHLVDLGDFTYREAADALGVPVGTVMSRLHRARRLLRIALADGQLGAAA